MNKDCGKDKIRNPHTKRCVGIKTPKGREVSLAFLENKVTLSPIDAKKVRQMYGKTEPPKPTQDKNNDILPTLHPNIDQKIYRFVKKWIQRYRQTKNIFSNKSLQHFCNKNQELKNSNMDITLRIQLNYQIWNWHIKWLDASSWTFTPSFHNKHYIGRTFDIQYNTVNYAFYQNFLRKDPKPYLTLEDIIDTEWLRQMNLFLQSLTIRERFQLFGYTNNSHFHINMYLYKKDFKMSFFYDWYIREGHSRINPFFYQILDLVHFVSKDDIFTSFSTFTHQYQQLISKIKLKNKYEIINGLLKQKAFSNGFLTLVFERYSKEFQDIIFRSPPLQKEMILYRGSSTDYFLTGSKKGTYQNESFVSCTISSSHAIGYTRGKKCCLHRLMLPKGSHALFVGGNTMYPVELEFVLPRDAYYTHLEVSHISLHNLGLSICPLPTNTKIYQLTDTIVLEPKKD